MKNISVQFLLLLLIMWGNAHAQLPKPPIVPYTATPISIANLVGPFYCFSFVGDAYISNDCFASIDKYLAKSLAMDDLVQENTDHVWSNQCNSGISSPDGGACTQSNYWDCPGAGYCNLRYNEDISAAVAVKAAFLRRTSRLWGYESWMKPGAYYYNSASTAPTDINKAYDCAGVRRPIIQAGIMEYIDSDVSNVLIPMDVTAAFATDPDYINSPNYSKYQSNNGKNVYFDIANIINDGTIGNGRTDLNKIECRMWYYYNATRYIDFGYKAIHMGDIFVISLNDPSIKYNDVGNEKTYALFAKIRAYAKSKGTFVLLDAHVKSNIFEGSTNNLLLDFNSYPILPVEYSPSCSGVPSGTYCSNDGDLNAVLVNDGQWDGGVNCYGAGLSPMGCEYGHTPYFLEFDNGNGLTSPLLTPGVTAPYCDYRSYSTYGFDDIRWFYSIPTEDCQNSVISNFYCGIRQLENSHRGYIQLVGREGIGSGDDTDQLPTSSPLYIPSTSQYRLSDHTSTENQIITLWTSKLNTGFSVDPLVGDLTGSLCGSFFSPGCVRGQYYNFNATNPDCSSTYTWNIQNPDGSWQPFTYGNSRTFQPTENGLYRVSLRQDNLDISPFSVNEYVIYANLTTTYCDKSILSCLSGLFRLSDTTNTSKNLNGSDIGVYPNPTFNIINLSNLPTQNSTFQYSIIDVLGEVRQSNSLTPNNTSASINVSTLSAGVYFIRLTDNKGLVYSSKFVKQ